MCAGFTLLLPEMMHFEAAIDGAHIEANRVYTDKGSASNANRQFKKSKRSEHRATRRTTLVTPEAGESIDQQKHYIIEQYFGAIKRLFRMGRASYFGTLKINAQVILKSICMNLKKAANKIFVDQPLKEEAIRPNVA